MDEMNADFLPAPLEAFDERRRQIREQREADEISARKHRHHELPAEEPQVLPPDDVAVEPNLLRLPQPFIDLRERAEKNQQHRQREEHDGQTERREKFPDARHHGGDLANAMNASRCWATVAASPSIL